MGRTVLVQIPVSPEAAVALGDPDKRMMVGKLVTDMVCPETPAHDPLARLIAEAKSQARADGLTDADIDAELADYKNERRL